MESTLIEIIRNIASSEVNEVGYLHGYTVLGQMIGIINKGQDFTNMHLPQIKHEDWAKYSSAKRIQTIRSFMNQELNFKFLAIMEGIEKL